MDTLSYDGINPFDNRIDAILAEIAFSVQLPPSLHGKAITRYEAVRKHLESTTSIFKDEIEHFYPQGSMAIDATISNRGTDDEYDLDIIAQLGNRFRRMEPLAILKELEKGLVGYRGLRVLRQTRCVTLYYSDNMHLDITPSLRDWGTPDRQSHITHAKGPQPSSDDSWVDMNAYGFVEWFRERTPIERKVADAFQKRWQDLNGGRIVADADVDDVPDQTEFVVKSNTTLALQLIKRYRNIRYTNRAGRMPPSVMLSYYAGVAARPGSSLTDSLLRISKWIVGEIHAATALGKKVHVENPTHPMDVFTDRWPKSIDEQVQFARDLQELISGIERAIRGEMLPTALQDWLRNAFGDRVVTRAVDQMAELAKQAAETGRQSYSRRGGIIIPATTTGSILATPASASSVQGSRHTYFGDRFK